MDFKINTQRDLKVLGLFKTLKEIIETLSDNCHYVDKHEDIECKHDGTWNRDPSDCMSEWNYIIIVASFFGKCIKA